MIAIQSSDDNVITLWVNRLLDMHFIIISYRSFALLRMTTKRNVVILSRAKDLYMKMTYNDVS